MDNLYFLKLIILRRRLATIIYAIPGDPPDPNAVTTATHPNLYLKSRKMWGMPSPLALEREKAGSASKSPTSSSF